MTGLAIEATLELWASSLRDIKSRMRPLFSQVRVATSAGQFLDGLLGEEFLKPLSLAWMLLQGPFNLLAAILEKSLLGNVRFLPIWIGD